jgi:hypothetical protein
VPTEWLKACVEDTGCVELAQLPDGKIGFRNSQDPSGPVVKFTPEELRSFLAGANTGKFAKLGL